MRLVSADSGTGQFRNPQEPSQAGEGDGSTTALLVRPVFTRGGDRRRRLLVRGGYLAAASCLAYLAMVLVSVTASPSARPAASAEGVTPTTTNQVTPQRPSRTAAAPVVAAVAPSRARQAPVAAPTTTTVPTSAPAAPSASGAATATPEASATTKPKKTKAGSSKTSAAKTTAPPAVVG